MKLASLKSGCDGRLVVVADDLATAAGAHAIAPTLQAALEDWAAVEPKLRALAARLNAGDGGGDPFRSFKQCLQQLRECFINWTLRTVGRDWSRHGTGGGKLERAANLVFDPRLSPCSANLVHRPASPG